MFNNKVLLITGGTGSFGNAVCQRFLKTGIKEIRILSRDEKKQDDMRKYYNSDKLKFFLVMFAIIIQLKVYFAALIMFFMRLH